MLGNLIIGALAGYLVPHVEPHLKKFLEQVALDELKLDPNELDLLTLIFMLICAAVLCALLGIYSSAFLLALGAGLGLFGKRIYHFVKVKVIKADRTKNDT
ncbi:hypothetical protein [Parasulfitobacter algicola]|uniref:Uncharacterized protein n=1 Tax=Parasulfitobacter algicola TaxID=2614809 RepID=A0ABX2INC3_9RHOB|nr:hypothetical protein [Sulfitobacter algicola]NSX54392.1 hypothetical protein [Sulfitobacter algicola]